MSIDSAAPSTSTSLPRQSRAAAVACVDLAEQAKAQLEDVAKQGLAINVVPAHVSEQEPLALGGHKMRHHRAASSRADLGLNHTPCTRLISAAADVPEELAAAEAEDSPPPPMVLPFVSASTVAVPLASDTHATPIDHGLNSSA